MTEELNYYVVIVDNYEESNRVEDYTGLVTKRGAERLAKLLNEVESEVNPYTCDYYMAVDKDHHDELHIKAFGGYYLV